MKDHLRKTAAVFLLFSLVLSIFSVSAGASVTDSSRNAFRSGADSSSEIAAGTDSLFEDRAEPAQVPGLSAATWKKVGSSWRLKGSNGKYKSGFVKYKGKWYFFDSKGNMKTGWFTYKGKKYFASRVVGAKGGGMILTGLFKITTNSYYYFDPSSKPVGAMKTGFQTIKKKRYYFDKNGRMKTGWFTVSGNKYYASKYNTTLGQLVTGKRQIGSKTYQFDSSGKLISTLSAGSGTAASSKYAHMIDVSEWNTNIDYNKVRQSGIKAVIIRCGYGQYLKNGTLNTDKYFYQNIKNAKAAGLPVGIYFFSYAYSPQQAINEANYCLRLIKAYNINLPVYFDWEYDSMTKAQKNMKRSAYKSTNWRTNITNMTAAFCNTIAQNGRRAGYYFNLHYLNTYYDTSKLSRYSTWYAFWGTNKPGSNIWSHANTMGTPTSFDVWQFTSRGKISGIKGNVDCDLLLNPSILK